MLSDDPDTRPPSFHALGIELRILGGDALTAALPELASLRTAVFREWPYLCDGNTEYEERYLAGFASPPGSVIVGAFLGDRMVGAATACPLGHADAAFREPFLAARLELSNWFYFGESVLEPSYRGSGIGVAFFSAREAVAREKGFERTCFCAVDRDPSDPRRPAEHVPLDAFWRRRGYAPLGLTARYEWRDVGDAEESAKPMRFWGRDLRT